jgi:glycosyltransferase involved in cell wall biosynthesis
LSTLSVIIITRNEEGNILECLNSVRWADEIIVLDSGSTDRTVERAKTVTPHVFQQPWEGFGKTKARALERATKEWVLSIDADERVPEALAKEIQHVVRQGKNSLSGYTVARRAFFLGKWIRHAGWYPGRVVRLFRRASASFTDTPVHESIHVNGRIGELQNDLLHYTDPNLVHYLEKLNRYTSLAVDELVRSGERFSLTKLLLHPAWTFFRMYILRRGFLDGMHGLILCALSACYVFTKYAKLWERTRTTTG